jgi:hypothetical protein
MGGMPMRHFRPQGVEQVVNYKTVMVSLALDRSNNACLSVAGDLVERFGARVIGVAASDIRPPLYFADGGFAQSSSMRRPPPPETLNLISVNTAG